MKNLPDFFFYSFIRVIDFGVMSLKLDNWKDLSPRLLKGRCF